MHEVTRNRTVVQKSKPGTLESLNPLVSTPGRGFTGIYIYMYMNAMYTMRGRERARERKRERERERELEM